MDTQELIQRLSGDLQDRRRNKPIAAFRRHLAMAAVVMGALAAFAVLLGWGARPDLGAALMSARGLIKFIALAAIGMAAFVLLARAAEPGRTLPGWILWCVLAALPTAGLVWAFDLSRDMSLLAHVGNPLGCALSIAGLAMAPLLILLTMLRSAAPTDPARAGGLAGLLAGSIAALGFALTCPMDVSPYVLVWYPATILVLGVLGSRLGRHLLVW